MVCSRRLHLQTLGSRACFFEYQRACFNVTMAPAEHTYMHISEWLAELITWSCQALKNTWLMTFNLASEWTCNFNEHSWDDKVMVGCLLQAFSSLSCSAFLAQHCSQTKFMKSTQSNDPLKVILLLLVACHTLLYSFLQLLPKIF